MKPLLRIIVSTGTGGVCYLVWLVIFLAIADRSAGQFRFILWIMAPVVTAAGFAAGIAILDPSLRQARQFLRLYAWPLVGCAVGAIGVYWRGPMLIVFGIIAGGAAAIILREIRHRR